MPGTYTHKFDTQVYKGSVTVHTGYVAGQYIGILVFKGIIIVYRLFIDGQWVDPVDKGDLIE